MLIITRELILFLLINNRAPRSKMLHIFMIHEIINYFRKHNYVIERENSRNVHSPPAKIVFPTYHFHSRMVQNIKAEM